MIISLDTETTGLDLNHGCRPFLVSTCNEEGENTWWEWYVDPRTRRVVANTQDLLEIQEVIQGAERIIFQNSKFDVTGLSLLADDLGVELVWPWERMLDTLYSGHLLASNQPRDLNTMSLVYLRKNLKPPAKVLEKCVKEAVEIVKDKFPDWRIARNKTTKVDPLPELPSTAKGSKAWSCDYWLPRAVAKQLEYPKDHLWWTAASTYCNEDTAATLGVYKVQQVRIKERGLEKIHAVRQRLPEVVTNIQRVGVTGSIKQLDRQLAEYRRVSDSMKNRCVNIAKELYNYDLTLPKAGNNKSLLEFVFGQKCTDCEGRGFTFMTKTSTVSCGTCLGRGRQGNLNLPPLSYSKKTGEPSLDQVTLEEYESSIPPRKPAYHFIKSLRAKRKRDTSISYGESYYRFMIREGDWFWLYPQLNPTGTNTLRWASQNPNEQNVSKKDIDGYSMRHGLGPRPEREWWSLDASNIELRIPAFESGEDEMVALFERPDDPPYYGSYHILIFDTLHPEKFKKYGMKCKDEYSDTWYQWTKNGNFAVQYGAVETSGTADRAYHVKGAQSKVMSRFTKIARLNKSMIDYAKQHGYVETIPDKTVDPTRGYPLLCSRSSSGHIMPTVPLAYHVSGTAMWWMMKGMLRVYDYLKEVNEKNRGGYHTIIQVHDELVFDFPRKKDKGNLPIIKNIQALMEEGGNDIGLPTPVNISYHPDNWGEGERIK